MESRRVADYFVVAGLERGQQLPLDEVSDESVTKPSARLDPITDITVINRSLDEKVPKGYEVLETTPTEYPANLNHGSMRWCSDMYLCYKRGQDKPPLKDVGVMYDGKENVMDGCEVVRTTPQGSSANVNNSTSSHIYISYRRADKCASSDTLVVVDLCIILGNKGEEPPITFLKIPKNLNKGVLGSDVFLCYKKAMVKNDALAYKASILGRYPLSDYDDFPLPESVPMFCLPMGATLECWSADAQHPVPSFSTFILTGAGGEKVYGAAVGFYEEYLEEDLTDLQMRALGLKNRVIREQFRIRKTVHVRKSISLLSHWPFFDAFKKFLSQLYKISITGPHQIPLERHISHFMYHVPYPSPERPRILVQLAHESLSLCMPEDSPLPHSGASFATLLRNLGPELTMSVLVFVMVESKILLHSLRPTVLTEVAEAVSQMIFPFHWQCPYIPLCPLGLSDVLNAPCPFIVGVDSRYFDLYDPPPDVICVDLDTNRIFQPEDKKSLSYKLLPKKASRVMQESLNQLFARASREKAAESEVNLQTTHFDDDFRHKKQMMQLELAIQEVFLRFTATILKDYKNFLKPITKEPSLRMTDAQKLFDMHGFTKSRDKANAKFFSQVMHTQMFFRFIEERSFVSDHDASLAFFDECTEKVDELRDEPKLIEMENTQTSERTKFVMPPEPTGLPEGVEYSYNGFPALKTELFLDKQREAPVPSKPVGPSSPLARRTKQEIKSAQKDALLQAGNPEKWGKCLLSYAYSLWFVVFPSFVHSHPKKYEALKIGFSALKDMQKAKLITVDELCYRVLMQLAGQYNKPGLAVLVYSQMKKHGVQPNAITYGYYNKVMLEAKWPSPQSAARLRWLKIRNVIIGVAQFRRVVRRRSLSLCSNSGSEFDRLSHTSVDLYLVQGKGGEVASGGRDITDAKNSASLEERMSTGGASDRGYNSMTQEDVKRMSQLVADDTGSASSPATSEGSDGKGRGESWAGTAMGYFNGLSNGERGGAERPKKEVHIVEDFTHPCFVSDRQRKGSIVKRTRAGSTSSDVELQKGALIMDSCGLLMMSKASVRQIKSSAETGAKLSNRRRHGSAGDPKPMRSLSLVHSRIIASTSPTNQSSIQFSDLPPENYPTMGEDSSSSVGDSAPLLRGSFASDSDSVVNSSHVFNKGTVSSSSHVGLNSCDKNISSGVMTPSVCNGESGSSHEFAGDKDIMLPQASSTPGLPLPKDNPQQPPADPTNKQLSTLNSQQHHSTEPGEEPVNRRELRRSVSISEDRLSGGNLGEIQMKTSLSESARALSDPNPEEPRTPQRRPAEDTQSVVSLTLPLRDRYPDFMLKRTQSLKKTNEAIGSFFKLASRASSAAYTKLNEFKQNVITPMRNGSLASLGGSYGSLQDEGDGGDGSSTSGTLRERLLGRGGSQDLLSPSEGSDDDKRLSSASFESAPSPSYLDQFPAQPDPPAPPGDQTSIDMVELAMEVEMSSCSRCTRCCRLIYDEEIMAGWTAEDSNLNTSCPYCHNKFAPTLQIYIKDWRGDKKAPSQTENGGTVTQTEAASKRNVENPVSKCLFQMGGDGLDSTPRPTPPSSLSHGEMPLTEQEAATSLRRHCTSECFSSIPDPAYQPDSPAHQFAPRSPLSLSISSEDPLGSPMAAAGNRCVAKEFMARSATSCEPAVVAYLSPLVLRKEIEYVLDHEGNLCVAQPAFAEEHPIIFWNLIWFFRRIELPTHLTVFLLTSQAFRCNKSLENDQSSGYTSRNVLIRPQWDNIRIHDEMGLPMYSAWRAGHKSTVVDALVIESDSFSRPLMWQIIASIQRNDVMAAIKLVTEARRRMSSRNRRFRSMYREILFLSFAHCGRENIDHDAFDREYLQAFEEKLKPSEVNRLQKDDRPKSRNMQWCRKLFSELEI